PVADRGCEHLTGRWHAPIGKVGPGGNLCFLPDGPRPRRSCGSPRADYACFCHGVKHEPAALLCGFEMLSRCKPGRCLNQAREHCRLRKVQLLRLAAEIMMRGGAQTIDAVAEIDARQISGENLLLREPSFKPEGD